MEITPEMVQALTTLRASARGLDIADVEWAVNTLDNAGVFAAIDAVTSYDVESDRTILDDPAPARVIECTCVYGYVKVAGKHLPTCPGNPVTGASAP